MKKLSPVKEFAPDHVLGGSQVGIQIKWVLALEPLPPQPFRGILRGGGALTAHGRSQDLWQEEQPSKDVEVGLSTTQLGAQCEGRRRGQRRQESGVPERWRELAGLSSWVMEAQGEGGIVIS